MQKGTKWREKRKKLKTFPPSIVMENVRLLVSEIM